MDLGFYERVGSANFCGAVGMLPREIFEFVGLLNAISRIWGSFQQDTKSIKIKITAYRQSVHIVTVRTNMQKTGVVWLNTPF